MGFCLDEWEVMIYGMVVHRSLSEFLWYDATENCILYLQKEFYVKYTAAKYNLCCMCIKPVLCNLWLWDKSNNFSRYKSKDLYRFQCRKLTRKNSIFSMQSLKISSEVPFHPNHSGVLWIDDFVIKDQSFTCAAIGLQDIILILILIWHSCLYITPPVPNFQQALQSHCKQIRG